MSRPIQTCQACGRKARYWIAFFPAQHGLPPFSLCLSRRACDRRKRRAKR